MPMILPFGPMAVVPATWMTLPILTAREYPTIGSQGAPLDMFFRSISAKASMPMIVSARLLVSESGRLAATVPVCQQGTLENLC
jgi:hypothetical protein